jgi:mannose-1-phosphate guanylyltransferase
MELKRAVIMAGGEGKRLRPFTHVVPKPLLPIGRKPIAQIIIERLRDSGFDEIIMAVEHGADLIRAYFQDGSQFGIGIEYYHEPVKLGTAGSLGRIARLVEYPFLVTNGDILTDLDYRLLLEKHVASVAAMTVAAREQDLVIPYGVLGVNNGEVTSVEEKPTMRYCFNAGVYALSPAALPHIPGDSPFDMTDLIASLLSNGMRVSAHVFSGLWFDLAKVDDFEKAMAHLEREQPNFFS